MPLVPESARALASPGPASASLPRPSGRSVRASSRSVQARGGSVRARDGSVRAGSHSVCASRGSLRAATYPRLLGLVATIALLAGVGPLAPATAGATILVFDQSRRGNEIVPTESGGDYPTGYGDNVTGAVMAVPGGAHTYGEAGEGFTPDVTVDITSSLATPGDPGVRLWSQGYGDLLNVAFTEGPGTAGAPLLFVRLTAAPGFVVDLYDFDLAHFGAVSTTIAGVSVLDGATELFSATDVVVAGSSGTPGHTTFAFATPLSAAELLIRIDLSNLPAGAQDNVGLDDVRFGQTPPRVIPEPGTAILLFAGLAGLARRRHASSPPVGRGAPVSVETSRRARHRLHPRRRCRALRSARGAAPSQ